MLKEITLPNIGDFKDVEVIEIGVKPGDAVKADQTLITLETDKAAMEVPSPEAGTVHELKVKVGDRISQGDLILVMDLQAGSDAAPESQSDSKTESKPEPKTEPASDPKTESKPESQQISEPEKASQAPSSLHFLSDKGHAGPATRRLAHELGLSLSDIKGTGQKGRVIKADIHNYVKTKLASINNITNGSGNMSGISIEPMPSIDFSKWGDIETQPVKRIQKLSAKFLHRNWVSIPHVTQFDEADITELEAFRQETKVHAEKIGLRLTILVFLMKSAVSALKQFPQFNSSLSADGQSLILKKYFHIGVAVDTPDGLVVPVIRDVDQKGIFDLTKELTQMSAKAREGKLTSADMQGGCFTLSSLGGIGGTSFTPIINAPEVAILGISKAALKPVYKNGNLEPRLLLPLSLSYDHRVIDGAQGARFLAALAAHLSDIRMLLL